MPYVGHTSPSRSHFLVWTRVISIITSDCTYARRIHHPKYRNFRWTRHVPELLLLYSTALVTSHACSHFTAGRFPRLLGSPPELFRVFTVRYSCQCSTNQYQNTITAGFCLASLFVWRSLQVRPSPPKGFPKFCCIRCRTFLQAECLSCYPTNCVKALME